MYEHIDYPKWIYKNGKGKIVQNSEEHEDAKKDGWGNHPGKQRGRPKKAAK